jgi:hypothetical protein
MARLARRHNAIISGIEQGIALAAPLLAFTTVAAVPSPGEAALISTW